jgi:hypothetical protein
MNNDKDAFDPIAEIEQLREAMNEITTQKAALAAPSVDPAPPTCSNCVAYRDGQCCLFPIASAVLPEHWCAQHRRTIDPAIFDTPLDSIALNLSAKTIAVLRRAKLRTIEDLLDLGRSAVTTNGSLDRNAIRELSAKLREFGIVW